MKKIKLLSILYLLSIPLLGQSLKPLGLGLPKPGTPAYHFSEVSATTYINACTDEKGISVLYIPYTFAYTLNDTSYIKYYYYIAVWKNNRWDTIPNLLFDNKSGANITPKLFKNNGVTYIYISDAHYQNPGCNLVGFPHSAYTMLKYENNSWQPFSPILSPGDAFYVGQQVNSAQQIRLEFSGDTVYYLEKIKRGNSLRYCLFRYNGSAWDTLPLPETSVNVSESWQLQRDSKGIYLSNSAHKGIYLIRGTSFQAIELPRIADSSYTNKNYKGDRIPLNYKSWYRFKDAIFSNEDSLGTSAWDGHKWNYMHGSKGLALSDFVEYKGNLYALGCDSSLDYANKIYRFDNNRWKALPLPFTSTDMLKELLVHDRMLYVSGIFKKEGCISIAQLPDKWGKLTGRVFQDDNNNCLKDSSEKFLKNQIIKINPGNFTVNTDENGIYEIFLIPKIYTIALHYKKYFTPCNQNDYAALVLGNEERDAGYIPVRRAAAKDLSINIGSLTGFRVRRGDFGKYYLIVNNLGTSTTSGDLVVQYDPRLTNFFSHDAITKVNDSTLSIEIKNLESDERRVFEFDLKANETKLINGNEVFFLAQLHVKGDGDSTDNLDTLRQKVVAAFDPNEKQCWPSGLVTPELKEIKYHIYFQNLGTDSAVRIRVLDSFDNRLPIEKVTLNGASHPYKVSLLNNVVTWTFDNIMLPPARDNYQRSQGYISFTAKIDSKLKHGDSIKNKAYIYFDYEEAVITNIAEISYNKLDTTTINLPKFKENDQLLVYPNPSSGKLHIEFSGENFGEIEIINTLGVRVYRVVKTKNSDFYIDLENLAAGVYIIRDERGRTAKFIIQR